MAAILDEYVVEFKRIRPKTYFLSLLIFYSAFPLWAASFPIPFVLGSLDEPYVRTPISMYMQAFGGWAITLPVSQEPCQCHHGSP